MRCRAGQGCCQLPDRLLRERTVDERSCGQDLGQVAKQNGLELSAFDGKKIEDLGGRYVKVEMMGLPLEPAPRTPAEGQVWDLFAGTVK